MNDTPVTAKPNPPPSRLDQWKSFIGDLARPVAIYLTSAAAAFATGKIAWTMAEKSTDFGGAAMFMTAVFGGLAGLYGFKAWENTKAGPANPAPPVAVPPPETGLSPPPSA